MENVYKTDEKQKKRHKNVTMREKKNYLKVPYLKRPPHERYEREWNNNGKSRDMNKKKCL